MGCFLPVRALITCEDVSIWDLGPERVSAWWETGENQKLQIVLEVLEPGASPKSSCSLKDKWEGLKVMEVISGRKNCLWDKRCLRSDSCSLEGSPSCWRRRGSVVHLGRPMGSMLEGLGTSCVLLQ